MCKWRKRSQFSIASGGGNAGTYPRHRSETMLQKAGLMFQWYILQETKQKSPKYAGKIFLQSQVYIEISKFLKNFQNFLHFWSKSAKLCTQFSNFSYFMVIIHEMLIILNSTTKCNRFPPKFSIHFIPFPIVPCGSNSILCGWF